MNAMKPFIEEHIICFVPTQQNTNHLHLLNSGEPVKDIFYYLLHNPVHFLVLMGKRLWSFFSFYRPYYSPIHNSYLTVTIIFIYGFALLAIKKFIFINTKAVNYYTFSLLIIYPLATTLQCDDYHSRFTIVIMPYFMLLAALGFWESGKRQIGPK